MPIQTDLTRAPYYDDYKEKDNYHRILFKPSVAVQVRELNQLQTILQNQIERFGDNVNKRGTIIDGCNFTFHANLPFAKINDTQTDGAPVNVSSFKGFFAKNSTNLIAQIVETSSGFEATSPNLNTLHLKYVSSGSSSNATAFSPGDVLTIYNPSLVVSEADVEVKSSGFSNADNLIIVSAIEVSNTTGGDDFVNASGQACTFTVGEIITQAVTGAQAEIREVNTTANVETLVLKIRPLASNLRVSNVASWLFAENYEITSSQSLITGVLTRNIGKDALGTIVTDSTGGVKSVAVLNGGTGYYVEPWLTVAYLTPNTSPTANAVIDALRISSKNYLCNVTVNDSTTSIGFGTGIAVSEGIIYQKGHFVRVNDQFIVVDKYDAQTNRVVGFDTIEEIVTFRQDQNLLDNASGSLNERAPGADRLKLTPKLVSLTLTQAEANNIFLPLIEYALGKPARQRKTTQFNSIARELAQRTFEESGNYILDQFLISTQDVDDIAQNSLVYRTKTDPGTAYIDGYRVQTLASSLTDTVKSISTTSRQTSLPISYGNFIRVKEVAGFFKFSVGDIISLRNTVSTYLSSSTAGQSTAQFPVPSAAGSEIGTAKIRSMQIEQGIHGTSDTVYKLYLFDIRMNTGKNFKDVRSVFYDGSGDNNGVADISLDGGSAAIYAAKNSSLIFPSGLQSLSSINSISYTYRTTTDNLSIGTNGRLSVSVAQNPGEYFDYSDSLSQDEKRTLTLIPLANTVATVNAPGEVIVSAAGIGNLVGVGTTFNTSFRSGDYIKVANSGGDFEIKRIIKIANGTHLAVDSAFSNNLGTANAVLFFPRYTPIVLETSDNRRTANVQSNTTLNISIGNTISPSVAVALSYDVRKSTESIPKTVRRNVFVKIDPTTNLGGSSGPWCLGHPDIFRLKAVYEGRTTEFSGNSTIVDSGNEFIKFTNDFLADGDVVIYRTETGSTNITGLSNNQSYYVVSANSTGVKLSLTSGGSAIDITATGTNTTQYLLSVSNTDVNATQNYYIDHNQRKDYYDVGFLYKNTRYAVPSNKLLLAQFDMMTSEQSGLKTVSSYPINDTTTLELNTSGIHTLEIPELLHDNGEYFDLRDSLDFRPYSSNTVAVSTTINQASINPLEPSSTARFNLLIDKKFPLPDSICDITVEKYLPRIDSVIILSNTAIKVVSGTPDESPKAPKLPKEGLLLNHLIIPPYPSLPKILSRATLEYLDKKVININAIKKRQTDHTISTPITPDGLPTFQSKVYTMEDIASLERRIADLEYYTSLSFTEDSVNNLQLTSSVDTTTNRFKFGFFVDNFTTSNFAEIRDRSYYAQIFGFELNPKKKQFKIEYSFNTNDQETINCIRGKKVVLPSREVVLINQKQATQATTIKIATTETTFTTTGTEITNTTTNTSEITVEEWELKTKEQNYQELVGEKKQVKKKVTKQREVVKDVKGPNEEVFIENINGKNGERGITITRSDGPLSYAFTSSKLGGTITITRSDKIGLYPELARLYRYENDNWVEITTVRDDLNANKTVNYSYVASNQTQFKITHATGTNKDYFIELTLTYPTSTQQTSLENYEEEITVTEDTTRYDPKAQTIFKVNKSTNTTTKEEVLVDTTVEEKTTSITKSLFNPKPSALMQMDQLFNLPGQINSPTIDLLSFIQDDINS